MLEEMGATGGVFTVLVMLVEGWVLQVVGVTVVLMRGVVKELSPVTAADLLKVEPHCWIPYSLFHLPLARCRLACNSLLKSSHS